jgi:hypothetical protein
VAARGKSGNLAFTQHDVNALESISHLIPGNERCGIYVLSFGNGEQYVGQSVDVVTRFAAHRRRWADIVTLDWHTCHEGVLDEREKGVIAAKLAADRKLRNILWARGPLGASPLDCTVTPDDQLAWLNGEDPFDAGTIERHVDEAQRIKKHAVFETLQRDPFFVWTVLALNLFVKATIPRPAATERKFWVLTAMPATNRSRGHYRLATLSINKVEVFWLFSTDIGGQQFPWGHLQLSRSLLTDRLGTSDFSAALGVDPDQVDFEQAGYETSGGDGLRIRFLGMSWLPLLMNEAVIEAARAFNLMLLRKGTSPLGHHHNYDLATWALDSDPISSLEPFVEPTAG